ncbi:hypothetical protein GCM10022408_09990 [Hymenobacter fastidiosus]|uniref:HTH deoR-type domain-containing protein n=1 Tax=Hymenobacter fastidiosus TaxID=486264 RepID=A0ABP7RRD1_9BACT
MNRFDRIVALLIQLQAKRVVKGPELAARYGVSLRTIYRDLRTLEQAGVPVWGEAGVGYSLADGYRLPPVMFTRDEATALLTADKLAAQLTDVPTAQRSQAAMDKLRAVLRRADRDYLEALSPHITVYRPWGAETGAVPDAQHQLLTSLATRRVVRLDYQAGYNGQLTVREAEPIGLYYAQHWHLVAFCRLRQDYRDFRLDRITRLELRPEQFRPRPDTLDSYWQRKAAERQLIKAVVRFGPAACRQRLGQKYYFGWAHEQPTATGSLDLTFWVPCSGELAHWLLPFADQATVLEPPALQEQLRELVQRLYQHYH